MTRPLAIIWVAMSMNALPMLANIVLMASSTVVVPVITPVIAEDMALDISLITVSDRLIIILFTIVLWI